MRLMLHELRGVPNVFGATIMDRRSRCSREWRRADPTHRDVGRVVHHDAVRVFRVSQCLGRRLSDSSQCNTGYWNSSWATNIRRCRRSQTDPEAFAVLQSTLEAPSLYDEVLGC